MGIYHQWTTSADHLPFEIILLSDDVSDPAGHIQVINLTVHERVPAETLDHCRHGYSSIAT